MRRTATAGAAASRFRRADGRETGSFHVGPDSSHVGPDTSIDTCPGAAGASNPGASNPGASNPGADNPGASNPGADNPGADTQGPFMP